MRNSNPKKIFASTFLEALPPNPRSNTRRKVRTNLVRTILLTGAIGGCNAILDNTPGQEESTTTSNPTDVPPSKPVEQPNTPSTPPPEEVPTSPSVPPTTPTDGGAPTCAAGQTLCSGLCVSANDPLYGCGNPSCTPCQAAHSTAACSANKCVLKACATGYSDCNQKPEDGCEVDLSRATSCGSCNAVCPAGSPICAPAGAGFQCTTGCTAAAPLLCGAECVAPLTSVNHCGGCNVKCPVVTNATATCTNGLCGFTCMAGYHACAGRCAAVSDPLACGPTCAVCPVPVNASAMCQADACTFQCKPGFGNCNTNAADGCEATFASDPLNCGVCGKSCNGGTCQGGVCQAPPPPPSDAGPG